MQPLIVRVEEPAAAKAPAPPALAAASRVRIVERGLLILGFAALALFGLCHLGAGIYQVVEGLRLEDARRRGASSRVIPAVAVGRLEIPRLGLSVVVRDGADARTLLLAAGHLPGSALPGEPGNVVVAGHRDSFFRGLRDIRAGDSIDIETPSRRIQYRVDSTLIVTPARTDLLDPTDHPTLTLITCYPFHFIGRAPKRFVVRARQIDPEIHLPGFRPLGTTDPKVL